jgi:hypothetical protein
MTIRDPLGFLIELFYDLDDHPDCDIDTLMDSLFAVPSLQPLLNNAAATQYGIEQLIMSHRSRDFASRWRHIICPAWNLRVCLESKSVASVQENR